MALEVLARAGLDTTGLRAKHVAEFQTPDAPRMDFVFTVCDLTAAEECAPWPGQPMTAHWGIPDPSAVQGTPEQIDRAFKEAFTTLSRRISLFLALPIATLDKLAIQKEITNIGHE
jgi:arsenate reductase